MGAARGKRGTVTVAERCVERCMAGVRQRACDDNGSGQPLTRSAGCCKGVGGGAACDRVPARQKKVGSNGRRGTNCNGLVGIRRAKKGSSTCLLSGIFFPEQCSRLGHGHRAVSLRTHAPSPCPVAALSGGTQAITNCKRRRK